MLATVCVPVVNAKCTLIHQCDPEKMSCIMSCPDPVFVLSPSHVIQVCRLHYQMPAILLLVSLSRKLPCARASLKESCLEWGGGGGWNVLFAIGFLLGGGLEVAVFVTRPWG